MQFQILESHREPSNGSKDRCCRFYQHSRAQFAPGFRVHPRANAGRGPPGRLCRPELQALSNSLQLT